MAKSNSHKTSPTKPNTNQNGEIDLNPGDTPTEADYTRDDQDVTPVNEAAFERPTETAENDPQ
ncbi:hypothetical protein ACQ4M3_12130 [Leptolyngbya sp. AN03gr2]|uniref:hypothetical protein n=1 Tax=unclassified Leptolyngbya TaxID=2650499 RepID=UPI003D31119E